MTKWALVFLAVVACSKKDKSVDVGSGATPPAEQKLDKLVAQIDGKKVEMSSALIKGLPDGRTQLYVSPNKVITCQELLSNVFNGRRPDSILVDLPVHLGTDGKEAGAVGDLYAAGGPPKATDAGGTSKVSAAPAKGAKVDVDLAFTATAGNGQKYDVKGTLQAEGCGDQPAEVGPGVPKQELASAGTITIAGKVFDVKGAIKKGDSYELVDNPRECLAAKYIGVRITKATDGSWHLDGQRIATEAVSAPAPGPQPIKVEPKKIGAKDIVQPVKIAKDGDSSGSGSAGSGSAGSGSADAALLNPLAIMAGDAKPGAGEVLPTVTLVFKGEGKIGDYPVKLDGKTEAFDCK